MLVGDFDSKLESFGCAKKNASGPVLKQTPKQLNLIYLNNDEHTHMDRSNGTIDLLDMAFISQNLAKHDIQSLYIYHFSTVIDFPSEKYSGSTGHRSSWYQ